MNDDTCFIGRISGRLLQSTGVLILIMTMACSRPAVEKPGNPLVYLDLNGVVRNTGLLNVTLRGGEYVSFSKGIADSCLDLSGSSMFRKPVVIEKKTENLLTDYPGITILLWTKAEHDDPFGYFIFGQKVYFEEMGMKGWSIGKSSLGSWNWWFSDGLNEAVYSPTLKRQPINDHTWHQIGFSVDFAQKEARLYYDGTNVAVISLETLDLSTTGTPFYLGSDPMAADPIMDAYNGKIDEVGIWSRALTPAQVGELYSEKSGFHISPPDENPETLTVLTWNIRLGGRRDGRYVGIQRVADVIKASGADVVAIQELFGSGETLADLLGFYYYQRSSGVGVLSRYPIGKSYNVFRPQNIGAVNIDLPDNRQMVFCPVWLNYLPNTRAYVTSGLALPDTIVAREMVTRGAEMRFILWELQSFINQKESTPVVLAGDFNSGSHLDWTEANKHNYYGLAVELPVSKFVLDAGFMDCYRSVYPDETKNRGITVPVNSKTEFQDRTDFIYYMGSGLKLVSSSIIQSAPEGFPSDHAAVVATFELE